MKKSVFLFLFLLVFFPMQIDAEETCEHEYVDTVVEPTCTENGYTVHSCINCDDSYSDSYIDAVGHSYVDYGTYEECEYCQDVIEKEETDESEDFTDSESIEETPEVVENGWSFVDGVWKYGENNEYINGWKKINNKWYYFDNSIMTVGYLDIDGTSYKFNDNGSLYTGWDKKEDNWYYYTNNGSVKDWMKINNKWYYFDECIMVTGYHEVDVVPFYFNDNGSLYNGWQQLSGIWYYFTNNGAKNDWFKNNNKWYYFDEYKMVTGYREIDVVPYYFNTSGSLYNGWQQLSDIWYYFTNNGAKNDWFKNNNKWYYFDEYKMVTGYQDIKGTSYKFKDNGALFYGWDQVDGNWYYYSSNGAMFKDGWNKINYNYYYFYDTGIMAKDTYIGEYYVNDRGIWSYKVLDKNTLISIINGLGKGLKYTIDCIDNSLITQLKSAISAIEKKGKNVSFVLVDLQNGSTISYETQKVYYAASSIKGPYVMSINKAYSNLPQSTKNTMEYTITVSSNEGYVELYRKYGDACMKDFMKYCGVTDFVYNGTEGHFYPNLTSKDLAKFWVGGYYYFFEDKNANSDYARSLYDRSYMSFINSAISSTVYTKPGSMAGYGLDARNDAGIVMSNKGPYVLSVTSNAVGMDGELTNLVKVLNKIQTSK